MDYKDERLPVKRVDDDRLPPKAVPVNDAADICTRIMADGSRCNRKSVIGENFCSVHWNGRRKQSRYFQSIPKNLLGAYQDLLEDGDYLSLRDEVAVLRVRLTELLAGAGSALELWKSLLDCFRELTDAINANDRDRFASNLDRLGVIIRAGVDQETKWKDVQKTIESVAKVTDVESRRLVQSRQAISIEQAVQLVSAITDSVKRHASLEAQRAISDDIAKLITLGR